MARVTVEDCVLKVPNRFDLVMLASQRARDIASGAPETVARDNDKNPVIALREIAEETVAPGDLKEDFIHSLQKHVEIDEPEHEALEAPAAGAPREQQVVFSEVEDRPEPEVTFDRLSEEELLAGIEGVVPPEKNDEF